jgi:hypothetical protein
VPILAENRKRYPPDWKKISRAVKERAGWRCACTGECGRQQEHSAPDKRCPNAHGQPALGFGWLVRLTTAHLDHTPENCADENLRAMCEVCHLAYDREHHAQTAARRKREGRALADLLDG